MTPAEARSIYRLCTFKGLGMPRARAGQRVWVTFNPRNPRMFAWSAHGQESADKVFRSHGFRPPIERLELVANKAAQRNTHAWVFAQIAAALGHQVNA